MGRRHRSLLSFGEMAMTDRKQGRAPKTQPAFSGRPPRPPKKTARGIEDEPLPSEERIALAKALKEKIRKGK